jgi:hypothetical protein
MSTSTKLVDKLEGVENFHAGQYMIGIIIEENDLAKFIKQNVPELEEETTKDKCKKDMVRDKRIIAESIKDHLIPQVSSNNSLTRMYEGKNIN